MKSLLKVRGPTLPYDRRETRDKLPLGRDPDRSWRHRHTSIIIIIIIISIIIIIIIILLLLFLSWNPIAQWTSAAAYECAAAQSMDA